MSLRSGLVSWWSMDQLLSGTSDNVLDLHGNNHLTYDGFGELAEINGQVGKALDYISGGFNGPTLGISDDVFDFRGEQNTLAFWFKSGASLRKENANFFGTPNMNGWAVLASNSSVRFVTNDTNSNNIVDGTDLDPDSWHFVVVWYEEINSTTIQGYLQVDNKQVITGQIEKPNVTSNRFGIGTVSFGQAILSMNGDIDETAIWNRVLTEDERAQLWNNGNGTRYAGTLGITYRTILGRPKPNGS